MWVENPSVIMEYERVHTDFHIRGPELRASVEFFMIEYKYVCDFSVRPVLRRSGSELFHIYCFQCSAKKHFKILDNV